MQGKSGVLQYFHERYCKEKLFAQKWHLLVDKFPTTCKRLCRIPQGTIVSFFTQTLFLKYIADNRVNLL